MSEVDAEILEQARQRTPRATVGIFRGRNGGAGSWGFDPDVDEADAVRLAEFLLRGQMFVYREMLRLGVCLFVHAEWGSLESAAYRSAATGIVAGLSASPQKLALMEKRMERIQRMAEALPVRI